jgi:hypothetical protein
MWILLVVNHHVSGHRDLLQLDSLDVGDNLDVKLTVLLFELPDPIVFKIPYALVEGFDGAHDGRLCLGVHRLLAGTHYPH